MNIAQTINSLFGKEIKEFLFPNQVVLEKLLALNLQPIEIKKVDCFHCENLTNMLGLSSRSNEKELVELFNSLVKKEVIENMEIDIRKIECVSASKSLSWGYSFDSLYSFGKNLIHNVGIEEIKKNDHYETFDGCIEHIIRGDRNFIFNIRYVKWEDRYLWSNDGGSHHFAVAVFHATNQKLPYQLKATITTKSIDENIANTLLQKYDMYVVNSEHRYKFREIFPSKEINILESEFYKNTIIAFEKNNVEMKPFIKFLNLYDEKYILKFNKFLENCLNKQKNSNS